MFWQRFYDLCVINSSKPNPIGEKIGISSATITQWKQGAIPSGESLTKIADYFNCSVDYLLGRTPIQTLKNGEISKEEKQLLEYFNALNDEGKEKALERLEEMAALDRYKKGSQSAVAEKEA